MFRRGRSFSASTFLLGGAMMLLAPAPDARASHHRGTDTWTDIAPNGVVTLHVTTRWKLGSIGDPTEGSGVDPARFGIQLDECHAPVNWPASMSIVRLPDEIPIIFWNQNSFSLSATTVAIETFPTYEARTQVMVIPLGSTSATGQINFPLLQSFGDYEIRWNDWSRVRGIQNLDPADPCGGSDSGYGFNVRVHYDGTSNHSPAFGPVNAIVGRGVPYSQNVNASDFDGDLLLYVLAPNNPFPPDLGPQTAIPGLTLDRATGQLQMPAGATSPLLDNGFAEPGADYLVKFRVTDAHGAVSEREILLDAVDTSGEATLLRVAPSSGSALQLSWTPACAATDHTVYWGNSPIVGGLSWTGAACALGTTGGALVDPGSPLPGKFVYFVVVGRTDSSEGSYGKSSAGTQRPEAVGVGACDLPQAPAAVCSP